jgi:hypothetical protein
MEMLMSYWRFFAMIATSTLIMFGLMYANSYAFEHLYFSETRTYMALYMGAMMAVVMLAYMLGMYSNKKANVAIFVGSAIVFAAALFLLRSQTTVQDRSWMSAMIPHHSIAILTSERAEISDPRVKKLAKEIIHAQNREIAEMRFLIDDIERNGVATEDYPLGRSDGPAPIQTLQEALGMVEIAGLRPAPLTAEEIDTALGGMAECIYTRAVNADPVLATTGNEGVIKLSGGLIKLQSEDNGIFNADAVTLTLREQEEGTDMIFDLATDPALRIGFNGYWTC